VILMEAVKEMVLQLITYSILSSGCLHLMPSKQYESMAEMAVGLGYICMILDGIRTFVGMG